MNQGILLLGLLIGAVFIFNRRQNVGVAEGSVLDPRIYGTTLPGTAGGYGEG